MNSGEFATIEAYMLHEMRDAAHDKYHVYRVLYAALDIAATESGVDMDVLLAAALLHDIGREKQFADPAVCHAQAGAEMAYGFLRGIGWSEEKALQVCACISAHRYRGDNEPQTAEAKILFDADKLDAAGALGIARTLVYQGQVGHALYTLDENGAIALMAPQHDDCVSFMQEYNYKLRHVYHKFYTARGRELAARERQAAADFYQGLLTQVEETHKQGARRLRELLD